MATGRGSLTDALVFAYLKKRGYAAAADALPPAAKLPASDVRREVQALAMETAVANRITLFEGSDNYIGAYARLRNWVYGSLDLYKPELLRVLYPVFVHCFLELLRGRAPAVARELLARFGGEHEAAHGHELRQLAALFSEEHAAASALARTFQANRFTVTLCRYAFELLMAFLQSGGDTLLLSLINEHVQLRLHAGAPGSADAEADDAADVAPRTGLPQDAVDSLNMRSGRWGVLSSSLLLRASQPERQGDAEDDAAPAAKKTKKAEKEAAKAAAAAAAGGALALVPDAAAMELVPSAQDAGAPTLTVVESGLPEGALPSLPELTELEILRDLRQRVRLGGGALPSVCMFTLSHAADRACCAAVSSSGAKMAAGFADSQLRLWDMDRASSERAAAAAHAAANGTAAPRAAPAAAHAVLTGHAGPVYAVDFTPADDYLLSAGGDATVRLWSVELCAPLMAYTGHSHPVWCVAASPAGHYFASGSYDRTARIWALDAPHARRVCVGHAADVDAVAWHPSCNYLATGSSDRSVRLWDVASGECVRVLTGHRTPPRALAFCPDGRTLASGSEDGSVVLWDLGSARRIASSHAAHPGGVHSLAWSAEGALLASGGADCALRLWSPGAGGEAPGVLPCARVLRTKGAQLQALRFSNRNLLFAVGSR